MSTRLSSTKKRVTVIVVAAAIILVGGGAAFAYWTSTGTGSGTATTGDAVNFTVVVGTSPDAPLTPGGPPQKVPFTVTNPGTGVQILNDVTVSVANPDGSTWKSVPGCSAADYTVDLASIGYGPIAAGGSADGSVLITMNDTGLNQDACKKATVPLYFAAS